MLPMVMVAGAGKMGSLVALLLAHSGRYRVLLVDKDFVIQDSHALSLDVLRKITLDLNNNAATTKLMREHQVIGVITCLPFFMNRKVADCAKQVGIHYIDLTEDNETADYIKTLAQDSHSIFMPRCGLAPGWTGMIAKNRTHDFETVHSVQIRTGGLPAYSNHPLQYALTWSTDGLINEYIKPCQAIVNGQLMSKVALGDLEPMQLDGTHYEAFNTSGGLGNLVDLLLGQVKELDYKSIRYPGHAVLMRFLLQDLRLDESPDLLKHILEHALPKSYDDVVILYVVVTGMRQGELVSESYAQKYYPADIAGIKWSAMQVTTASAVCACADEVWSHPERYSSGYLAVETLSMQAILANTFGQRLQGVDHGAH